MVLQTSPNIAQARGRDPLTGISRWATRSTKFLGAAALIALLSSPPSFADAAAESSRAGQQHHACAVIQGLDPSGSQYDTCIRSLRRSLTAWDQAQAVQTNRRACAEKGLEPSTPAFALCVVIGT